MPIDLDPTKPRSELKLREYWRHMRVRNCARCHRPIDYDGPRMFEIVKRINGRLVRQWKQNPWALDVGHIVEKDITRKRLYAPIETRPEHAICNRKAGAAYGNRKRGRIKRLRAQALRTSRDWP
jgi:hypothetical protein